MQIIVRWPTTVPNLKMPTGGPIFSPISLQGTLTNRTLTSLVSDCLINVFGRKTLF
ncbi:hypothetical protein HanXRQr2_Chr09g0371121 [Helianthus annuus]|uniref:Uncharacterized protein n=1 Tax=Helianthus annuus TaxID=4232 RepID=A0A9K3N737_HELAN|nr:hypothetical protein HanXRQr2_Chr09g0371121 [Helianthus annuus]KAJ0891729.1 hypothetical protein HanPSC8_Chr09g0357511 [Helianthus annuus]